MRPREEAYVIPALFEKLIPSFRIADLSPTNQFLKGRTA